MFVISTDRGHDWRVGIATWFSSISSHGGVVRSAVKCVWVLWMCLWFECVVLAKLPQRRYWSGRYCRVERPRLEAAHVPCKNPDRRFIDRCNPQGSTPPPPRFITMAFQTKPTLLSTTLFQMPYTARFYVYVASALTLQK